MQSNCSEGGFSSLKDVRNDHALLSVQSINYFPFCCTFFSKYHCQYLQLHVWFKPFTLKLCWDAHCIQYFSNILITVVTGRQVWWARSPWNGASSPVQQLGYFRSKYWRPEAKEVGRGIIQLKNGVIWVLSKFQKRILSKKPFVNLSCDIFAFEEARPNSFFRNSTPNHNRGTAVWHLMKVIWTFQSPDPTVLLVDKSW